MNPSIIFALLIGSLSAAGQIGATGERPTTVNAEAASVRVHVRYATKSRWTESEIRERFANLQKIFNTSCKIKIELASLQPLPADGPQDMTGGTNTTGIQTKRTMRGATTTAEPIFLYVRNGFHEESPGSSITAQAYMLGDAKTPGNLFLHRFYEVKDIHGVIVLSDHYSQRNPKASERLVHGKFGPLDVDAHELGHILLNDAGHNANKDIMSYKIDASPIFTRAQCARMRTYHAREQALLRERETELRNLCLKHERARSEFPSACDQAISSTPPATSPPAAKENQKRPVAR